MLRYVSTHYSGRVFLAYFGDVQWAVKETVACERRAGVKCLSCQIPGQEQVQWSTDPMVVEGSGREEWWVRHNVLEKRLARRSRGSERIDAECHLLVNNTRYSLFIQRKFESHVYKMGNQNKRCDISISAKKGFDKSQHTFKCIV